MGYRFESKSVLNLTNRQASNDLKQNSIRKKVHRLESRGYIPLGKIKLCPQTLVKGSLVGSFENFPTVNLGTPPGHIKSFREKWQNIDFKEGLEGILMGV